MPDSLDRSKPYGTLCGRLPEMPTARHVQGGRYFDEQGAPIILSARNPRTSPADAGMPAAAPHTATPKITPKPVKIGPPYDSPHYTVAELRAEYKQRTGVKLRRTSKKPEVIGLLEEFDLNNPETSPGTKPGPTIFS